MITFYVEAVIEAARKGDALAQFELAQMYEYGILPIKSDGDPTKAVIFYRQSAEQGYCPAQVHLGIMYKNGWGVPRNLKTARKWFIAAISSAPKQPPRKVSSDKVIEAIMNQRMSKRRRREIVMGKSSEPGRNSLPLQNSTAKATRPSFSDRISKPWFVSEPMSDAELAEWAESWMTCAKTYLEEIESPDLLNEALQSLEGMIGLKNVKAQIRRLIDLVEIQVKRDLFGLEPVETALHLVFTGNPGTGKTTVARYVGQIYEALGLLGKGHVVEAHREDLVAAYIGQTAIKTKAKIQEALDGVLFIDEAYSLHVKHTTNEDFGKEAVSTLVAEMENNRDRLAVIVAGYPEEMKEFINMNPGLKSRFTRYIEFEDYQPKELVQIFMKLAAGRYEIHEKAHSALLTHMKVAHAKRTRDFGNGRYVRMIFQEAVERHATRAKKSGLQDRASLALLMAADVPDCSL